MFSSRTNWNLSANALSALVDEKRFRGEQILDLTESNPTHCGFRYDPAVLSALGSEDSLLYEPDSHGLLTARESVAAYYGQSGIRVEPKNIFLTASTSEAYSHLFKLLCDAGDSVLVPRPSYPLFDYLCKLNDVESVSYRLRYADEWYLDRESVREGIDASTKAILLVHPNNPTGSFIKKQEKEWFVDTAIHRGLPLIVDEVFQEYPMSDGQGACGSFSGERDGLVFTLGGISKMLGLPQLKLAWIVLSGTASNVREARNRLEIVLDTFLSVGTPIQQALPALFRDGSSVTRQIQARIQTNQAQLQRVVAGQPFSLMKTEGGWNAILLLPDICSDDEWAIRFLREHNVLVYPGHFFEIERNSCIVISLLPQESVFSEALSRILDSTARTFSG